ncbi:hypothetical protein SAMN05444422_102516 [Halobiforma haloterrestris]|uniref:Uncharacterized protein n=1 Tax=Natronobacterium haloterrestre TaxID=148448 RepID=A0A1I1EKF4_NATHA|nr:hypothetical protein SAMN05444422_102516 [Halobiforma haloterrestris]
MEEATHEDVKQAIQQLEREKESEETGFDYADDIIVADG